MTISTKHGETQFILLLIFQVSGIISLPTCSIKMCLSCTFEPGILKLTCKIDNLHLPVSIHNNFNEEIAFCSLPFPSPLCSSRYKNTTVSQNIYTNETVVTIREIIDQRINGNWSCLHGYGRDMYKADIEISIPKFEGEHKKEETDGEHKKEETDGEHKKEETKGLIGNWIPVIFGVIISGISLTVFSIIYKRKK